MVSEVNSGVHNLSTKRYHKKRKCYYDNREKRKQAKSRRLPDARNEGLTEVFFHAAFRALRSNVCVDESRGITTTLTSLSHLGCEAGLRARACCETGYVGGLFINTAVLET